MIIKRNQTVSSPTLEELLDFPCEFPIKIMGINVAELISEVSAIISIHARDFDPKRGISVRLSSKGTYLSITATITAHSKEQLDNIYLALNKHPLVKFTL